MLGAVSITQFCAQIFNVYAAETAVAEIFGGNIDRLKGLGALFRYNVFIYSLFAMACLSLVYIPFQTWKQPKPKRLYEEGVRV